MSTYIWQGSAWVKDQDGKPIVIVVGRDIETKEVKRIGVKGVVPYFYAKDEVGEYEDCFGGRVSKITCTTPDEVPTLRLKYDKTFEADIPFDYRYLIDRGISYGFDENMEAVDTPVMEPRICYFDIEVDSPNEIMPSIETVEWPICMIQCLDNYTGKYTIFTLGGEQVDDCQIVCETEVELLKSFAKYIGTLDFDIITGWFSMGFDVPYIMRRARKLKVYMEGISRIPGKHGNEERWPGRNCIDLLKFYKDWSKPEGQLPTYDLKFVSNKIAKFTYEDYGDRIRDLIEVGDWKTLVEYGKSDVRALQLIDKGTGLIMFYESLRRLVGLKFEDILSRSKIIEYLLMRRGIKPIPTRIHKDEVQNGFKGALVLDPPIGIHEWVGVTDLKALYPSIIIAFNISPDKEKMIPKVIVELMNVREEMRRQRMDGTADEHLKTSEQSLKYIINAFYGYLAFTGARLYEPTFAAFITKTGREIATDLHTELRRMGKTVIYGDTDSTFTTPISSADEGRKVEEALNLYLLQWASVHKISTSHAPTLKLEKIYRKVMFKRSSGSEDAAKKRYAGWLMWKDGHVVDRLDYTGLEIKRSDTSQVTRAMMEYFFEKVLREGDITDAVRYVNECTRKMSNGNFSLRSIGIPKGVHSKNANTAWVRGVRNGEQLLGIKFREDKKPKLIYCRRPVDVICIDDDIEEAKVLEVCEVDWKKMVEVNITKKMKSIMESLGINWNHVMHGQQSLDGW